MRNAVHLSYRVTKLSVILDQHTRSPLQPLRGKASPHRGYSLPQDHPGVNHIFMNAFIVVEKEIDAPRLSAHTHAHGHLCAGIGAPT